MVATLHEYGWWRWPERLPEAVVAPLERRGWWDRETLRLSVAADGLITTNPTHEAVVRERLGAHPPLRVVPIAANVTGGVGRCDARLRLGLGNEPLVVFFGFVHPVKGIRTLIEATQRLLAIHPTLRLVLVGGIESLALRGDEARCWHDEVLDLAATHGLDDRLTLTGWVSDDEVSAWLSAADVVALPFSAGLSTKSGSLLAAASHGAPIVGTQPTRRIPSWSTASWPGWCRRATLRPWPTRWPPSSPRPRSGTVAAGRASAGRRPLMACDRRRPR